MDSHNRKEVKRHRRDKNGEINQKRESTWKYFMFLLFNVCNYSEYGGSETFYGSRKYFVVYKISYVENGYVCSILGYFSQNCRIISPSRSRKKPGNKKYITIYSVIQLSQSLYRDASNFGDNWATWSWDFLKNLQKFNWK